MSVRFIENNSSNNTDVVAKTFSSAPLPVLTPWIRNPSWPACEANSGDNRVRGLYAVWPSGGNFIALTVIGAYTVNYGDGTTTNYATGIQANYEFSYTNANLVGTEAPVTFTDSTDTVNRTAHGYTNGMQVQFFNITTTTGIVNAQFYFVINATANTFQVSATVEGSAVVLTNDGTGQLLPYRIATVTITPQDGNTLTTVNLAVKHNQANLQVYSTGWLDLAFAASTITNLQIASAAQPINHTYLERARLNQLGAVGSFVSLFLSCTALQNVEISNTITTISSMASMFTQCRSLQTLPLFDISSVTNLNNAFSSCSSLRTVPLFNIRTASAVSMSSTFSGCSSLQTVPLFNTVAVVNMSSMFSGCTGLQTVPLFNTVAVTDMNTMFGSCASLQTVPLFNTAAVTNMSSMFTGCSNLRTVPLFNTAAATDISSMFSACFSLQTVPLFNIRTASAVNMTSMFQSCNSLQTVPLFNTVAVTNMSSMFNGCSSLQTVPLFNTALVTNMSSMFNNCSSLQTVPLFNTAVASNMSNMFSNCSSLQTVPLFNTAAATNMSSMFSSCFSLRTVPLFNTAAVTNMGSMFTNASSLQTVPLFNTALVTSLSSMFTNAHALQAVPAFNVSTVGSSAAFNNAFTPCRSLSRIEAKNFRFTFSVASCKLSATALNEIYTNLPTVAASQTLTVTSNYGVDNAVTKSVTTTAQSLTVPMAVTSDLTVGGFVTGVGTGITTGVSVTSNVIDDTFTLTNHGLTDGKRVSFSTLGTTTGISAWTIYFVVGATANRFQVALTAGGAAIDLTGTNATLNARYPSVITAITPGVSVTLDTPAATSGATTLSFRTLDSSTALLKNWAITF